MQQTIWKRGLALILALMLTVSAVPTAAWAQEDVTEPTETLETVPAPTESQPAPTGEETIPAESTEPAETIPAESTVPEESTAPVETVAEETAPTLPESVQAVQARIDALPTVDTVTAADYDAVQDAYDAYDALTEEEKALIQGAEVFEALFAWFNAQTATLETVAGGSLTWTLDDTGTLTISGTGAMANYTYSSLAPWFANRNSITAAVIEDGVTNIGEYAFYYCTKLESITIADSVTRIGRSAFENCTKLANVTIPEGVTSIGDDAFEDCDALTSVTIPGSVTRIGSDAFYGCAKLASVTLTEGLTTIGSSAFERCSSLESITIPASVTSIGSWAFQSCTSLESITIPASVTTIGSRAFWDCTRLTSVTLTEGLTTIGSSAFERCSSLESITIPASVTDIGTGAFRGCTKLTNLQVVEDNPSFSVRDGVLFSKDGTMLYQAVGSPSGAYTIPEGVTSIGDSAFSNCSSLESITIPEGVTSIGDSAFSNCSSLESITIPASVTFIGDSAFYDCSSLTGIQVAAGNECYASVDGILYDIGKTEIRAIPQRISGAVTIPEGITSIGGYAFEYCTSLESITIPEGVTTIENGTFYCCGSLTSITIPKGVTTIEGSAFYYCRSLESITIPEGVTSIGDSAFSECSNLKSITIPASVTSIGDGAFSECDSLKTVEFRGNAPSLDSWTFGSITTTILYPSGNDTWAAAASGSYSASLTWKAVGTATEISVQTAPRRTMYQQGETEADLTGLVLLAADANGTTWEVLPGDEVTATMDTSSTGWTEVTLTWRGLTATYQIAVHSQGGRTLQPAADYPQASYYDEYGPEIRRSWTYSVPGADELVLTFTGDTHMEDWCDYLTLYDGTGAQIGEYTGTELAGKTIRVSGDSLRLSLYIDGSWTDCAFGFSSIYSVTYGHEADGDGVYTPHTCFADGYTSYTCAICGLSYTVKDPGTAGHTIEDGFCTVCGLPENGVAAGKLGESVSWAIDGEGGLFLYGQGEMPDRGSYSQDYEAMDAYLGEITRLVILDGITSLCDNGFSYYNYLTTVTMADSVTQLGQAVFYSCPDLTSVTLSANLTAIPFDTFSECTSLKSIAIPAGVTEIGDWAFNNCPLETVTFAGTRAQFAQITIGDQNDALYNVDVICSDGTYGDGGSCGESLIWILGDTGTLTISGTGNMPDYTDSDSMPWNSCKEAITSVVLEAGVTSIGEYAFFACTNLTSVTIPESVTRIGASAFGGCV